MTIKEINKDLFDIPSDYALAHCISADFALGAGIAKEFDKRFNCREKLFGICDKSFAPRWDAIPKQYRGNCLITSNEPIIFNLITKRNYWDKPTLETIENALDMMRIGCEVCKVNKLAMPRIGCGLDKQKWADIKPLIEKVFANTDVEIVVCIKEKNGRA